MINIIDMNNLKLLTYKTLDSELYFTVCREMKKKCVFNRMNLCVNQKIKT